MFGYDHGGWMFGGGFGMILIWLVPIALAIWFFSSWNKRSGQDSSEQTAPDILKARYARGEIGKDEFEQKQRSLKS